MSHSAFDKLRIASPALMLGAALAGGAARGATVGLSTSFTTGGVEYSEIGNSTVSLATGAGSISSGYGIDDATLTSPRQNDAFDGFGGIAVNRTFFNQPGDQVDLTTTADGTFVSTLTPQDIGGIDTSLDYFMDGDSPTLRVLATFTNTTNGPLSGIEVLYGGNLGSDDNTQIEATSSGDTVFQQADRWLISSEGDGGGSPDPILTFVRYGEGSVQAASDTLAVLGIDSTGDPSFDNFTDQWTLSLDPGETQSLAWFVQFNEYDLNDPNASIGNAISNADVFDDLGTLNTAGLLAAEGGGTIGTANIVNWGPGQPASAPVPGALPLFGIGLFGLGAMRRRSRRD